MHMARGKAIQTPRVNDKPKLVRIKTFETVTFFDETQKRQVIVLYSLGEDGILREFTGGKWTPFPVIAEPV
jgi:hypothetical protein